MFRHEYPEIRFLITCSSLSRGFGGEGGVYAVTLKPKNIWPNGRWRAAGTLTPDSSVSFETILRLLENFSVIEVVRRTNSLCLYDLTAVRNLLSVPMTNALALCLSPIKCFTFTFKALPVITILADGSDACLCSGKTAA